MDLLYENKRFYAQLLAFEAAMLLFSISGNFILLFVAWEFLSITSYLLIGFWNYKESAARAARETITIIFIGDIALLACIILLFHAYQTLDFSLLISTITASSLSAAGSVAFLLLAVAIFTKSAQFPFHEWLPAAMEGPTPVSAFLHSSTMVKAGVFVVMVLYPLFGAAHLLPVIAVIGAITVIIGIGNALGGGHIKKVLAYSTVEELGLMLFALGTGNYSAAVFFFFAQTFYKALLFFYAGVLTKANGTENLEEMKEAGHNKLLLFSGIFGVLALAGFIPFNGFFANMFMEGGASSILTYGFMLLIDLGVSLLIFRWFLIPAQKITAPGKRAKLHIAYDTIPKSMLYPMLVLAVACLLSGFLFSNLSGFLSSSNTYGFNANTKVSLGINDMLLETIVIVVGAVIAYRMYSTRKSVSRSQRGVIVNLLLNNSSITESGYMLVSNFSYYFAGLFEMIDVAINENLDNVGKVISMLGSNVRRVETGSVNIYALLMIIGLLCLILFVVIG
jgi:NADH-quinone oxidoreductase subunit L